jgi:hypothetical protein
MAVPQATTPVSFLPFAEERRTAIPIELRPALPEIQVIVACEDTRVFMPVAIWLDSAMQGPFMLSQAHYAALGSPKPLGKVESIVANGQVMALDYVKVDVVFGNMKFLNVPATINPSLPKTSIMGWAILSQCNYGYIQGRPPGLYYNRARTFIFPDLPPTANS